MELLWDVLFKDEWIYKYLNTTLEEWQILYCCLDPEN